MGCALLNADRLGANAAPDARRADEADARRGERSWLSIFLPGSWSYGIHLPQRQTDFALSCQQPNNVLTAIRGEVFDLTGIPNTHFRIVDVIPTQAILKYSDQVADNIFPA